MPLIIDDDSPALDTGRLTFRERLRTGRAVPIVSNRAIYDRMLNGYEPFLASYARYVRYPLLLGRFNSLVDLVKFHKHRPREKPLTDQALKFDYLNYVKNHLYRLAKAGVLTRIRWTGPRPRWTRCRRRNSPTAWAIRASAARTIPCCCWPTCRSRRS